MNLLTQHQQKVFDEIVSAIETRSNTILRSTNIEDYLLSLTGAAGTGKTFLVTQIAQYLKNKYTVEKNSNYLFTITAPTHKAVGVLSQILFENQIEASCRTIHSFLGIKPFVDYDTGEERFVIDKTKKTKDTAPILIVDESSMISLELFEYILEAIEDGRVGLVLFIGDPYQLLPVNNSKNSIYKLKNSYVLDEVVRQAKDSYIIKLATKLRERIKKQNFIDIKRFLEENMEPEIQFFHNKESFLEDFYKEEAWHKEDKILATHKNKDVDAFNKTIRNKYWEQQGNFTPSTLLQGDLLRFKESYSVEDVTIYHNGQVVNVDSAELKYQESLEIEYWECKAMNSQSQQSFRVVDPNSMSVFNDKLHLLAKMAKRTAHPEKQKIWKAFYQARDMFADVQYVHSSTIHKLQGSTYDVAYVDVFALAHNSYMSNDEKYRLLYVAITRASKDIKIFISAFDNTKAIENSSVKDCLSISEKHKDIDDLLKNIMFKQ